MRFLLISICIFFCAGVFSQEGAIQKVRGLPTEEVYDLFEDSRGFIWVGHSLGISRYDGHSFTHFSCPGQTSLGTAGICEDKQGRIWCFNFNGQLFYIANEQMQLFKAYNASEDMGFPYIAVLDSELVATVDSGLFVCNTRTLQSRTYHASRSKTERTLAIFNNAAITGNHPYKYVPGKGFYEIPLVIQGNVRLDLWELPTLLPLHTTDTIYGYNNTALKQYRLLERNDTLFAVSSKDVSSLVNTMVKIGDDVWVNTKRESFTTNGSQKISGHNLSDIVKDRNGNTWFSSLQEGLTVLPAYTGWQKKELSLLPKGDFIRCMITAGDEVIYGTQGGKVIVLHNDQLLASFSIPRQFGSVEELFMLPNGRLVIAPSVGLFTANIQQKTLFTISDKETVKNITLTDTSMLLAYSQRLSKISYTPLLRHSLFQKAPGGNDLAFENEFRKAVASREITIKNSRTYFVNYDHSSKKTFVLFKNGLTELIRDSTVPVLYKNKPLLATCLLQYDGHVYVGTLNSGFIIKTNTGMESVSVEQGLASNTVLKMKLFGTHLLLVEPGYMQIWDIVTRQFSVTIPLPNESLGAVYDFLQLKDVVYFTFSNTLYQLRLSDLVSSPPSAYLLGVTNTRSNTVVPQDANLSYKNNDLKFSLSSPAYVHPEAVYFMYHLAGTNDTSWQRINGPVYTILYASLKPGTYLFEAYAVNFRGERSANTIRFVFSIDKPWWLQWWFMILELLFAIGIALFLFLLRLAYIKKRDRLLIEKLTLQDDLRKSLLRTIIAQMNPHFIFNALNTIQSFVYRNDKHSVSNYMGKFSELIRKILDTSNIDAITLGEEIEILSLYLELEKARFEDNFNVQLTIQPDLDPSAVSIPPMFIQPYIENAIKHGLFHKKGERNLFISISFDKEDKDYVRIVVEDDGIGRQLSSEINRNLNRKYKSFAISALENRIMLINQALQKKIEVSITDKPNAAGTIVIIRLPIINV
jgi:two-component sensor histidine kinase